MLYIIKVIASYLVPFTSFPEDDGASVLITVSFFDLSFINTILIYLFYVLRQSKHSLKAIPLAANECK